MSNRFANALYAGLLATCALSFSPAASAKQCIWNKGGYVMSVSWFRPIDLGAGRVHGNIGHLQNNAPPVQVHSVASGAGVCTNTDEELVAFISVVGCIGVQILPGNPSLNCTFNQSIWVDPGVKATNVKGDPRRVETPGCVDRTWGHCSIPYLAMTPPLPDSTVLVVMPSTRHYLDFWGSTFDVKWGQGGPIN